MLIITVIGFLKLHLSVFSVVPHITDAIQEWVMKQATISVDDDGMEPQVCVIEVSCSQHVGICVVDIAGQVKGHWTPLSIRNFKVPTTSICPSPVVCDQGFFS